MIALWPIYGGCFATDLEKYFRKKHNSSDTYSDPFIKHYLKKFLNLEASARTINFVSYGLVVVLAIIVFTN